jgi:polyisoprenoid-binding protein YceI
MPWTIDPMHSHVAFSIKHMMISTVHGQFHQFSGTLELDDADLSRSSASGAIEVASLDTGVANRDDHLRSAEFFDVGQFPEITYRSSLIEQTGDHTFRVSGDLTIRGVTREIALDVDYGGRRTDPQGQTRIGFNATGSLNRKDFGLVWNVALEAGGVMVGDTVRITIDAEAILQTAPIPALAGSR